MGAEQLKVTNSVRHCCGMGSLMVFVLFCFVELLDMDLALWKLCLL